jgi:ribosome biogenesis ATPase
MAWKRVIDTKAAKVNDLESRLMVLETCSDTLDLNNLEVLMSDFEAGVKNIQPAAKREGFATVPDVTWDDVGALKDVRKQIELGVLARVNHPEKALAYHLEAPTGVLLCGPPGCGKTLVAKAVANQAGINFISVKGPELLNMVSPSFTNECHKDPSSVE